MFGFKSPTVDVARTNLALRDLLLTHGADLSRRWRPGGRGVNANQTRCVDRVLREHLVERLTAPSEPV